MAPVEQTKAASIVMDGDLADWATIPEQASKDVSIPFWKAAQDDDYVYICGHEWRSYTWQGHPMGSNAGQWVAFQYANGNQGQYRQFSLSFDENTNTAKLIDNTWNVVPEGIVGMKMTDDKLEGDVEFAIPKSLLPDTNFTLTYCGTTISIQDIPVITDTPEPTPEPAPGGDDADEPKYQGIVIDGMFLDWVPIEKKYDVNSNLKETAVVWDGDIVYIYVKEDPNSYEGNIIHGTPYSNGNFCIETDTGYKTPIFITGPSNGEPKATIDGKELNMRYNDHMYEVAVPVDMLRGYNDKTKSLNFGTIGAPDSKPNEIITGIPNWNPKPTDENIDPGEGEKPGGNDIDFDHDFTDWDDYPHETIDYSTGGKDGADAEAAIFATGEFIYGHVKYYGAHYDDIFGFFELAVNNDLKTILQLSAKATDSNGNPIDNYNMNGLGEGTYEFHIFGPETKNGGAWTTDYGVIYIEVSATGQIEAEFRLDESKATHFYGCETEDLKIIEMRFIRIGDKWVSCAGTSTGPIIGIILCIGVVVGAQMYRKKRHKIVA